MSMNALLAIYMWHKVINLDPLSFDFSVRFIIESELLKDILTEALSVVFEYINEIKVDALTKLIKALGIFLKTLNSSLLLA